MLESSLCALGWKKIALPVQRISACLLAGSFFLASLPQFVRAQNNQEKKDLPKVILSSPLSLPIGSLQKVVLRGLKLNDATEVRCGTAPIMARILSKGAAAVPNQFEGARVGDQQVEVELQLPPETPAGELPVVVVTPAGESAAYSILVRGPEPIQEDKEPNDSFAKPQALTLPAVIEGSIHQPQNVDLFRFEAKSGQKLVAEVQAARRGSALDSLLTLYDARMRPLTAHDDLPESRDSRLEYEFSAGGVYYLLLQDALDQGSSIHLYRLNVEIK